MCTHVYLSLHEYIYVQVLDVICSWNKIIHSIKHGLTFDEMVDVTNITFIKILYSLHLSKNLTQLDIMVFYVSTTAISWV